MATKREKKVNVITWQYLHLGEKMMGTRSLKP